MSFDIFPDWCFWWLWHRLQLIRTTYQIVVVGICTRVIFPISIESSLGILNILNASRLTLNFIDTIVVVLTKIVAHTIHVHVVDARLAIHLILTVTLQLLFIFVSGRWICEATGATGSQTLTYILIQQLNWVRCDFVFWLFSSSPLHRQDYLLSTTSTRRTLLVRRGYLFRWYFGTLFGTWTFQIVATICIWVQILVFERIVTLHFIF